MALKRKVTKDEFDALKDDIKAEYKPNPTNANEYLLDADDANELSNALERQKEAARVEKERADRLQGEKDAADTAAAEARDEANRKKGDIASIENSWREKVEAEKLKGEQSAAGLRNQLTTLLVRNVALAMATEISTSPTLILPHIEKRLAANLDGPEAATRVLDKNGQPGALTLDELKKEFIDNKEFAAIIIASKATGGNANGNRQTGNAGGKLISQMTEPERIALHREIGGPEFNRRAEAERVAARAA